MHDTCIINMMYHCSFCTVEIHMYLVTGSFDEFLVCANVVTYMYMYTSVIGSPVSLYTCTCIYHKGHERFLTRRDLEKCLIQTSDLITTASV